MAPTLTTRDGTPAPPDGPVDAVIRRVETLAEYQECVAIQGETWGADFTESVSATILQIAQKVGGVVAGAFADDGRMLGFVFGMAGVMNGRFIHWSDLLAVRPEARGGRLGERLKHYQRGLARATGASAMYWTFDPLVARNAHLNLARLGARAVEYVPNMYGDNTSSPLHGALPTDRLVVEWDLASLDGAAGDGVPSDGVPSDGVPSDGVPSDGVPSDGVPSDGVPSDGVPSDAGSRDAVLRLTGVGADRVPALAATLPDAPRVQIAIPTDFQALPPELRAAWRATTRDAFVAYFGRGYAVRTFRRDAGGDLPYYELERAA